MYSFGVRRNHTFVHTHVAVTRRTGQDRQRERAWLAAIRLDDVDAFEQLYRAYFLPLWEFAAYRVPGDIAEEIVQDVLFSLWRRRHDLAADDYLGPYLFAAVRSKVIQHVRHRRVIDATEQEYPDDRLGAGEALALPDDDTAYHELRDAIHDALSGLSEQHRTILTLRWTQGMTYDEIAMVLGISRDAAKKAGARAQQKVLPKLQRFNDAE